MEQRSIIAHAAYREAQDKFDHFVLGAIVAVCAYLSQHLTFKPLGWNPETVMLGALLLFGLSALFGFKRIEFVVVGYRLNHQYLDAAERSNRPVAEQANELLLRCKAKTNFYYKGRNWLIVAGFICYLAAKLFGAYQ